MLGLGPAELLIVGLVAVLLFGKKLPDVARSLGGSYREFRKGLTDFQSQMNVDNYRAPTSSYSSSRQSYNNDYAEEPTAPKFEPPPAEPKSDTSSVDVVKSESGEGTATV